MSISTMRRATLSRNSASGSSSSSALASDHHTSEVPQSRTTSNQASSTRNVAEMIVSGTSACRRCAAARAVSESNTSSAMSKPTQAKFQCRAAYRVGRWKAR